MSRRKKRMISMVLGVIVCAIAVWLIVQFIQKRDAKEFAQKCRSYVGIWTSDNGEYEMTVRRVTGAHAILSLYNKATNTVLESVVAHAVSGDKYEFTYNLEQDIYSGVNIAEPGEKERGSIELLDSSLRLEVPNVRKDYEALDFQGVFKKKTVWKEESIHLLDNMGTANTVHENLKEYCSFEKGKDGKVERIRMLWEKTGERFFYSDIKGINKLCFAGDCKAAFGEADREEELSAGRKKLIFHDATYQYTFIVNSDGLVVEGDCQYIDIPGMTREGDFLLQGDTLVRYLGDYEKKRDVILPEGVKRIASHAFTEDILNDDYICPFKLTLPKDVIVEAEAFAGCSRMELSFEEGWTEIPERAFADMVQNKNPLLLKESWVTVTLPKTMKRLGKGAFYQDSIAIDEMIIKDPVNEEETIKYPITVWLNKGLEVIEEDALSGLILREYLPDSVRKVGRGVTLLSNAAITSLTLPASLEELGEDAIRIIDGDYIERINIPDSLRKWGENAIYDAVSYRYYRYDYTDIGVGKNNRYFKKNRKGWLTSRDGKILYKRLTLEDEDDYLEIGRDISVKVNIGDGYVKAEVRIPEGAEEIRLDALRDIHNLLEGYYNTEDYVGDEDSEEIKTRETFIYPKSMKRISRRALFATHQKQKFLGDIPEFSGTIDEQDGYQTKEIYVKKGQKEKFLQKLFEGQQSLTEKTKKRIRSRVKTYHSFDIVQ